MRTKPFARQVTGPAQGKTSFPRYDGAVDGLRGYWYPVMFSSSLGTKPVGITLCGEQVAFIRDARGTPRALQDRCPHRGIPLSMGRQEFPDTLTCAYHGWTYDLTSGRLVAALTDGPDSPICTNRTVHVRTFPTAEAGGVVWVHIPETTGGSTGDGEVPPVDAQIPGEFLDGEHLVLGRITDQEGDWRHAVEAGFDEGHAKYLHRNSLWKLFRYLPAWSKIDVTASDDGRWLVRTVRDKGFQEHYPGLGTWPPKKPFWKAYEGAGRAKVSPPVVAITLPGILQVAYAEHPLGAFTFWEFWAPTMPGRYRYYQFLTQRARGPAALRMRLAYGVYLRWVYHVLFNGQDTAIIKRMRTPPESLYRPDKSIIAWRRLCEEHLAARDKP